MKKSIFKNINLLYIEDEPSVREIYETRLGEKFKNLYVAQNGKEGYELYREHKPDIIVTDIQMPVLNGIEMIKLIRAEDPNVTIIVTTAYSDSSYLMDAIKYGVSGYLLKAIDKNELYELLEQHSKAILFEKERETKNNILQYIIDADTHMLTVTNWDEITFSNKTFRKFFDIKDCEEFNSKFGSFLDLFMEQDSFLHKGLLKENESFIELLLRTEESKRNVMIFDYSDFLPKSFNIKATPIDRVDDEDIYLITFFDISEITLERVSMESKAYYDSLTEVFNRNKINEVLQYEIERSARYGESFSLILIDIDHFKKFNDTYGHLIGDEVLKLFSGTLQKICRNSDTFGRWGGEEFIMILPNTTIQKAAKVAQNLKEAIEVMSHEKAGRITASFGVAQHIEGDNENSIYSRADKALYLAKQNGRNRVEISN